MLRRCWASSVSAKPKTAVVLFNLGGPDRLEAVRPFLTNLFSDPAILSLPGPLRWLLARRIAAKRTKIAQSIYAELGGGSPILANTEVQAQALETQLGTGHKVFICMRYWHPMAAEVADAVRDFGPDRIVLLPLYPQYSTTTTASSFADWHRAAAHSGLSAETSAVCCFPDESGFVGALANRIVPLISKARESEPKNGKTTLRVLLSAHGLPKRVIARGDPYQWQVETTAAAVAKRLGEELGLAKDDCIVCYQSRVGPLEWIGPSTDDEIKRAGRDGTALVVAPVAFVSEHSETLVELDVEYAELAREAGVPLYLRAPTVDADEAFIGGLVRLVNAASRAGNGCMSGNGARICPSSWQGCALPAA